MTKVSIIIPTYNEELFIKSCISSLLKQTYPFKSMDILVVDGGSTDRTKDIVQEMTEMYSNIRLLNNSKKIQSAAFNIGVKNSKSPIVIRLDAHAYYDENYINFCIQNLEQHKEYGNVGGIWDIRPQNHRLIPESNALLNKLSFGIGGAAYRIGAKPSFVDSVPFGAFPRTVLDTIGGMREDLPRGEDNEFNSRIRKYGFKIFLDPRIKCIYFARATVRASVKQMYNNGFSIGVLLHLDRHSVRLRHLVPMLFVLSLLGSAILSTFIPKMLFFLACIFLLYIFVALSVSIRASILYGIKYLLTLPWLFFLIHFSYGLGTIWGTIKCKY